MTLNLKNRIMNLITVQIKGYNNQLPNEDKVIEKHYKILPRNKALNEKQQFDSGVAEVSIKRF